MAAPKRSKEQIELDRVEVARLYLRGHSQPEIARLVTEARIEAVEAELKRELHPIEQNEHEFSLAMVKYDLGKIREAWRQSALIAFDARIAEELARIDNLEVEYWRAWERSTHNKEIEVGRIIGTSGGQPERTEAMTRSEGQAGDPRFLQGVAWCIDRRCKLLGLDKPDKVAIVDWREELPEGYDAGTVEAQFTALLTAAAAQKEDGL